VVFPLDRTNVFRLKPTKQQEQMLIKLCRLSVALWNSINYKRRQSLIKGSFTWDVSDVIGRFSDVLGKSITWRIVKKNNSTWKAYFALRKKNKGSKVGLPRYWKSRDKNASWDTILRTEIGRNDYEIVWGTNHRKSYLIINWPPGEQLKIRINGNPRWSGYFGRIEIVYDGVTKRWYCYQFVASDHVPELKKNSTKKCYVDLGVVNIITSWIEDSSKIIAYSGRPLLGDWWYWTRRIARYQSALNKRGIKTSRKLRLLYRKREKRFKQTINTIVHRFVKYCHENGVSEIIVGDIHNIREDIKTRSKKINALLFNFWEYNYIINRLKVTAENFGIDIRFIDEKGTSSYCIRCGSRNIIRKGRLVKCNSCGLEAHRDVVGVLNIAMRYSNKRPRKLIAHPFVISILPRPFLPKKREDDNTIKLDIQPTDFMRNIK